MNSNTKNKSESQIRIRILYIYIGLVILWTLFSALVWSRELRPASMNLGPILPLVLFFPFGLTSWPAHEMCLVLTGKGLGANALSNLSPLSFALFFLWSLFLWCPLLTMVWKKFPAWLGAILQGGLILLLSMLFWRYGNG